ncbi:MAG: prepilin-type N-terminal cleavage/methylation domain-containing protein, partial [Acidimicrobiales bacterium]
MSRPSEAARSFFTCRTPGALRRLRDAGDDGFTLIELVVVLVILPLIMGALAVALLVTFQEQVGVSTRISTSADAQVTSAYFVRDVESAMYVTTATTPAPGSVAWPSTAGPTGACGSGTALIVSLAWPTGQQPIDKTATVVSYWRMPKGLLERELCRGSASPSSGITSRDFLSPFAHALVSCVASEPSCGTTANTRWVPAVWVSGITIAATEPLTKTAPLSKTKGSTKGSYDFNLTAAPRASSTQGAYAHTISGTHRTGTKPPPLLALGGLGVVTESSTGVYKTVVHVVTGNAVLNTGYFSMTHGTTFTAPLIDVMKKTACNTGMCRGTICAKTKNTCTPPTKPAAVWTHLTTAVTDPFAKLPDPTPVTRTLPLITTCPHTGRLTPGEYDCGGSTPLTVKGTVTLAHGIYIFDTGLAVNGNAAALTGTTVLIYLPCKASDPWVPAGTKAATCSERFQVTKGVVTMTPLGTTPYADLWFWQNKGDTKKASVHGQGAISVSTGVLYAPGAEVD